MAVNDPVVQENYTNGSAELLYCPVHQFAFRPDERIHRDAFTRCPKGGELLVSWKDRATGRYYADTEPDPEDEYWEWADA